MVKDSDKSWHGGNINSISLGVELEDLDPKTKKGCLNDPEWCTDIEYRTAVELFALLCKKYKVPIDNIYGHNSDFVRKFGTFHADPGPYWDMVKFKEDVRKIMEILK
jgi:N-acetyl-anhydromuramyl-L-alanine amidase AmpD